MTITNTPPSDPVGTWATDADTRVEPSAEDQETGFEFKEKPAFNIINWLFGTLFDWVLWLSTAVPELDDTKLNRDCTQKLTGTGRLEPENDDEISLGHPDRRFERLDVIEAHVNLLVLSTASDEGIASDVLPDTTNAYDIGSNSRRFKDAYFDGDVTADNGIFSGDLDVSGVVGADLFQPTTSEQNPGSVLDLASLTKSGRVLACAVVTDSGTPAVASDSYNVSGVSRPGGSPVGIYIVTFNQSINVNASVQVTPRKPTFGTYFVTNYNIGASGGRMVAVTVAVFEVTLAGVAALVDADFSLTVSGEAS